MPLRHPASRLSLETQPLSYGLWQSLDDFRTLVLRPLLPQYLASDVPLEHDQLPIYRHRLLPCAARTRACKSASSGP